MEIVLSKVFRKRHYPKGGKMKFIKVSLLIAALFTLQACGFSVVDTGHRGVKVEFGTVVGESLPEGLYFYNPISTSILEMDVRTQNYQLKSEAYSQDAQIVTISLDVNLNLVPTAANTMYKEVGYDWADKIAAPILKGLTKEIVGQYKAVELISERNAISAKIKNVLEEKLATKHIQLTNMEISNLDFDNQFEEAVKDKVIAVERAKEAKNKTVRIQEEARQKIISAEAEAKSMSIRARALTQNKSLVEYEAVQKWDGKMPQFTGGALPFINLKPDAK